ncbi:MAG: glycerol-3-phosphate 1-O-acyltransferase PlsY [Aaplasma endosymbiont of Hyalomma asiaticum]
MEKHIFYAYIIAAYFLGSIPFALILTRVFSGKDIRKVGSQNVGATNVFRVNKILSFFVLVLDILKSYVIVFLAQKHEDISHFQQYFIGLFAITGHVFPIWLKFRGGKGVATTIGVLAAVNVYILATFITIWSVVFLLTRYASAASILAVTSSIAASLITEDKNVVIVNLVIAAIIIVSHRQNIVRIVKRTENKL